MASDEPQSFEEVQNRTNKYHMQVALDEARKSPPKPTNFCVGAVLVGSTVDLDMFTFTGYTLECEGNTHAEQCCLIKLAAENEGSLERAGQDVHTAHLYTTMEPCNKRSPGNKPCVDRIIEWRGADGTPAIKKVFIGVTEPETFVGENQGRARLEAAGIEVIHVPGFEEELLKVATAGHVKPEA